MKGQLKALLEGLLITASTAEFISRNVITGLKIKTSPGTTKAFSGTALECDNFEQVRGKQRENIMPTDT